MASKKANKKSAPVSNAAQGTFRVIPVKSLLADPDFNARSAGWEKGSGGKASEREDGDFADLCASIASEGVRDPIDVRPSRTKGKFSVIAGFRRLAAAEKAGLDSVPCMVFEHLSEAEALARNLQENMQRAGFRGYDLARAIDRYATALADERGCRPTDLSDGEVAAGCGTSQPTVWRARNAFKVAPSVKKMWDGAAIKVGLSDMAEIAKLKTPEEQEKAFQAKLGKVRAKPGKKAAQSTEDAAVAKACAAVENLAICVARGWVTLTAPIGEGALDAAGLSGIVTLNKKGEAAVVAAATSAYTKAVQAERKRIAEKLAKLEKAGEEALAEAEEDSDDE